MSGLSVSSQSVTDIGIKNFWDPKGYLSISRRTSDGYAFCDQLRHMIEGLESAVTSFSKNLGVWSESWKAKIAKNGDCGASVTSAILRLIEATEAVKASQTTLAADLRINVINEVKKYQKANYRRNLVGKIREAADVEAGFAASEAPWSKLLKKMNKAKHRYHDLSKKIINMKHQETVARHDTSKTPDELDEMRVKIGKLELEEVEAKAAYRDSLNKLESYQLKYRENMVFQYEKADAIEVRRLNCFHSLVDKSKEAVSKLCSGKSHENMVESLSLLGTSVSSICIDDDLREYRRKHGVDMPFQMPSCEEYTENLHQFLCGQKLGKKLSSNHVGGGIKSLSKLNPFKSISDSILPSSVQNDATEGSGDRVTVLRITPKESGFDLVATALVDDNNNDTTNIEDGDAIPFVGGNLPPKRTKSVSFEAVVDELAERHKFNKEQETTKQVQVVTVSPSVRRSDNVDPEENDPEVEVPVEADAGRPGAQIVVPVDVEPNHSGINPIESTHETRSFHSANVEGSNVENSRHAFPEMRSRPANSRLHHAPSMVAEEGVPTRGPEAPVVTLTRPTPERDDDEASIFGERVNLTPFTKVKESMEASQTSVTDPRLLSSDGGDGGDGGCFGGDAPIPTRYLETGSNATAADGDFASDGDFTPDDLTVEEPEMTLARGGSALLGLTSSFEADLTLPNNGDGRHTPMQVSTGLKAPRPSDIPVASSPVCHVIGALSFGDLGASMSDRASPSFVGKFSA